MDLPFTERFFNVAGPCRPEQHYMLPPEERLPGVRRLLYAGHYLVVHAARQTGKTTSFLHLAESITAQGKAAALWTSCETAQAARGDVGRAERNVLDALDDNAAHFLPEELRPPQVDFERRAPGSRLGAVLRAWCERCPRPVMVFFDEIDALLDEALIAVLRQLRGGYQRRPAAFPWAVALIGLRDVRDYRARVRDESESLGTASPFNIKVESLGLRDFSEGEVSRLLAQHEEETGQPFSGEARARVFELTRGQPWLVNALARQITWYDVEDRAVAITPEHVDAAKETLIERRDTHLDSLVDKLREPRVQRVIEPILAGSGASVSPADVRYVEDLGLVRSRPQLAIANPIYQEVIPRELAWVTQIQVTHQPHWYIDEQGRLDMDALMAGFRAFWLEHAEPFLAMQPYPEAAPHLVLTAFLQRIVNGGGHILREYAAGSRRMDLLITWPVQGQPPQREAIELKVWHPGRPDPLGNGLDQLAGYLQRLCLDQGTLVLFDRRPDAPPIPERTQLTTTEHNGRRIRVLRA